MISILLPAVATAVLSVGTVAPSPQEQKSEARAALPEELKTKVLDTLEFSRPIEKTFSNLFSSPGGRNMFAAMIEGDTSSGLWQTKLLIPRGYLVKRGTRTERGQLDWKEYGELLSGGVRDLEPTPKIRPYLRVARDGSATLQLGRRVLESVDYSNRWQMNGLDTWSFTFTYFIDPLLPDLPRLGPYKGKGSAQINPATGGYDAVTAQDVGERFGSSLSDKGAEEYLAWLEGSTGSSTAPASSATPPSGTPATAPAPVVEEKADCPDVDACLRAGAAARSSDDWRRAAAFFSRAAGLADSNPAGWVDLGQAQMAAGEYSKGAAAWDKALALGSSLELGACLSGFNCKAGTLSLSKDSFSFVSEKGEVAFSAPPGDFVTKGPKRAKVMLSDSTAVWLEVEGKTKKWKVSFLPPGVGGCKKTASYLCPDPGPDTQEAVAGYVKQRLDRLARGEPLEVASPAAGPPTP